MRPPIDTARPSSAARIGLAACVVAACALACGGEAPSGDGLTGTVRVDGSSTVFPITEAVAEEFQLDVRGVRVTVGISGTGGGFKKFCRGEIDVNDASRPVDATEVETCSAAGVEFIELPVAFDGLSVVVNPANDFVDRLAVEELRSIWEPSSGVMRWSDVRPQWPEREIHLYGPGTDSGTFDYFTEAVVGESGASRPDFTQSEDDNVLVQGVAGDVDALGYFGYAYYDENRDRLKAVAIDPGDGPVLPSAETIADGTYRPLSRPLLIYVAGDARARPEVDAFVHFYLEHAAELAAEVGYVGLPPEVYELARQRYDRGITESVFAGGAQVGVTLEELLRLETE